MRAAALFVPTLLLSFLLPATALGDFYYYNAEPSGVALHYDHPIFSQQLASGSVSGMQCTVSFLGKTVSMPYDAASGAFTYVWPSALAKGSYTAVVTLDASGYQPIVSDLSFSVAQDAVSSLPAPSLYDIATGRIVNYARAAVGLNPLSIDPSLSAAALSHANYVMDHQNLYPNSVSVHSEPSPSASGYTGSQPFDRDNAFGSVAGGSEVIAFDPTLSLSLVDLFDTTFHRFGLLDPTAYAFGAGFSSTPSFTASMNDIYVADFDTRNEPKGQPFTVLFPWKSETSVPVAFNGESPDPLAGIAPPGQGNLTPESGYPVTITLDPAQVKSMQVSTATITDPSGGTVPAWLVDHQNYSDKNPVYTGESMGTSAALFPQKALQYDTTYTAAITGTATLQSGGTQPFSDTWSFTTTPAPKAMKAFQTGGYLFLTGQNVSQVYVSNYAFPRGNVNVGPTLYQDGSLVVYPVTGGALSSVTLTDGATNASLGSVNVASQGPFSDAGTSASSQLAVNEAGAQGIVAGFLDGTYRPNQSVTDQQALVMIYRALGSPSVPAGAQTPPGISSWATSAVAWASAAGVLQPQDAFAPDSQATRAQLATWLMRAYSLSPSTAPSGFTDGSRIPAAFLGYVSAAHHLGIVQGYPDGSFRPGAVVSRGAFAIWLEHLYEALPNPAGLF